MWRSSFLLGRIGDIRLELRLSAVVGVAVLTTILALKLLPVTTPDEPSVRYWFGGLAVALAFLASVVVHELAHAFVARRHGVPTRRVVLWLFGGAAEQTAAPANPRAEAMIAVSGPATSVVLGLICWASALLVDPLLPSVPLVSLLWLGTANFVFAGVALLPGTPLDGGRLVRALVWARTNDRGHADRVARRCGKVLGTALIAVGTAEVFLFGQFVGIWLAILGWALSGVATAERLHPGTDTVTP